MEDFALIMNAANQLEQKNVFSLDLEEYLNNLRLFKIYIFK